MKIRVHQLVDNVHIIKVLSGWRANNVSNDNDLLERRIGTQYKHTSKDHSCTSLSLKCKLEMWEIIHYRRSKVISYHPTSNKEPYSRLLREFQIKTREGSVTFSWSIWQRSLISRNVRFASILLSKAFPIFLMATASPVSESYSELHKNNPVICQYFFQCHLELERRSLTAVQYAHQTRLNYPAVPTKKNLIYMIALYSWHFLPAVTYISEMSAYTP